MAKKIVEKIYLTEKPIFELYLNSNFLKCIFKKCNFYKFFFPETFFQKFFQKQEFGFNDTINYKTENVSERLGHLAPEGIDIYWDNVGGVISDDVIRAVS